VTYTEGNANGKHYWLTPADLMAEIQAEFDIDFDPCPYPKPDDFDGLEAEWGASNYVNPPFGMFGEKSRKAGPTAWARKAIAEHRKGKRVVYVYPVDRWILEMLEAGATVRNLGGVKWVAIEDGEPGPGASRPIAMFILEGDKNVEK